MKPPRRCLAPSLFLFLCLFLFLVGSLPPSLPAQNSANPSSPTTPQPPIAPGSLLPQTGLPLGLPPSAPLGFPPSTSTPSNPQSLAPLPSSLPESTPPNDLSSRLPLIPSSPPDNGSEKTLGDLPEFELTTRKPQAPIPDGPNRTEEAALRRVQRIHYRETKARALLSPEVQAALEVSRKARSDRELRASLQTHYERLYARMAQIDPALTPLLEEQKKRSIAPLQQTLPRTPHPLSPTPAPAPASAPAPDSDLTSSPQP
jgi:hypothetical protein